MCTAVCTQDHVYYTIDALAAAGLAIPDDVPDRIAAAEAELPAPIPVADVMASCFCRVRRDLLEHILDANGLWWEIDDIGDYQVAWDDPRLDGDD